MFCSDLTPNKASYKYKDSLLDSSFLSVCIILYTGIWVWSIYDLIDFCCWCFRQSRHVRIPAGEVSPHYYLHRQSRKNDS